MVTLECILAGTLLPVTSFLSSRPPLIFAGIYAATLSSAIASFVGAPRVLQAVAEDDLYPVLKFFAKVLFFCSNFAQIASCIHSLID